MKDWKGFAKQSWRRASLTLGTARRVLPHDPDSASNRAYYAAFHAVTAFFALQGKSFSKHGSVEAAVHRDLVHAKVWPVELGQAYTNLVHARYTGDYGGFVHVTKEEARDAIDSAERILKAVHDACPDSFPWED